MIIYSDSTGGSGTLTYTVPASGIVFTTVEEKTRSIEDFKPERIVYSGLTTILFWKDGTKTIVRCGENDEYERDNAVAHAIAHKMFGSKNQFKKFVENGHESLSVEMEESLKRDKEIRRLAKLNADRDEFPF